MKATEAQRRANKKYYLSHYEYYKEKSKENAKKIRRERREYKARIDKAIEYCKIVIKDKNGIYLDMPRYILELLQGDNND